MPHLDIEHLNCILNRLDDDSRAAFHLILQELCEHHKEVLALTARVNTLEEGNHNDGK